MTTAGFVNVWESESLQGIWVPYSPELCKVIENEFHRSNGLGSVDLGPHSLEHSGFVIDFHAMREVDIYTNDTSMVRQQSYPCTCPFARGVLWRWWADIKWQLYDVSTSNFIEEMYQRRLPTVDLAQSPIRIPNIIDFHQMEQRNKKTNNCRKVFREVTREQFPLALMSRRLGNTQNNSSFPILPPHVPVSSTGYSMIPHSQYNTSLSGNRLPSYLSANVPGIGSNSFHGHTMPAPPALNYSNQVGFVPLAQSYGNRHGSSYHTSNGTTLPVAAMSQAMPVKPHPTTASLGGPLSGFTKPVKNLADLSDDCAICLVSLKTASDFDINPSADVQCVSADIVKLLKCKHMFHRICLQKLYESGMKNGCLQCPTCKTMHGIKKGNQPSGGTMSVTTNSRSIPGYPGYGSIVIVYNFSSGLQGENHPNPGQPYFASSFPRTCYLPNNPKGQKVLRLLQKAFDRQLVFTIGMSFTTGQDNAVVWNGIHHKTEGYQNNSGYGYPDLAYLDNVLAELEAHGVTEDS